MTSSAVAASSAEGAQYGEQPDGANHWIFPLGLVAATLSAASTAVAAATRRLSEVAQTHRLFASAASGVRETRMSPCPAALTLLGASSVVPASETCSPASALEICTKSAGRSNCKLRDIAFPWKIGACKICMEGSNTSPLVIFR